MPQAITTIRLNGGLVLGSYQAMKHNRSQCWLKWRFRLQCRYMDLSLSLAYHVLKDKRTDRDTSTLEVYVQNNGTNVHISVTKWCIVGYWTGTMWDIFNRSIVSARSQ